MVKISKEEFQPNSILTREQAAKIICYLLLGEEDAEKLTTNYPIFSDVPANRWSAPYISYCVNLGILAGDGHGNFYPEGKLTGVAFAKMLLVALGYNAERENYVGNNWEINTSAAAIAVGISPKGLVLSNELSRQDAAQMAFNALQATMVEYLNDNTIIIGDTTVSTVGKASAVPQSPYTDTLDQKNLQFAEKYFSDLKKKDITDAFERPSINWVYGKTDIGTYLNSKLMVEEYTTEVTGKDLYDLIGSNIIKDYELIVAIDGVTDEKVNGFFTASDLNKNNKKGVGATGNGVLTQVFVDPVDEEITVAIINTYLAFADKDYDEKKDELDITAYGLEKANKEYVKVASNRSNNVNDKVSFTLSGEDFDVAEAVEGDALLVTVAKGDVQTIADPEIIADTKITAFKKNSNVTVDGTKYSYADSAEYDFEVLDNYTGAAGTNLKNVTYNVYLDAYGYAIGVDLVSAPNNYLFITGIDKSYSNLANKTLSASAIFVDGTTKVIEVKSDKGDVPAGTALVNSWCTYTVDKDGVYTVTEVAGKIDTDKGVKVAQYAAPNHDTLIDKKHTSLPGAASGSFNKVYGNDSTVYLTASIKEIMVGTGVSNIIIDGVDSVTTGLKNANIQPWNKATAKAEADDDIANPSSDNASGVYTLYKSNGYIIASVVVGEDAAASKNLVYAHTGDVTEEGYDETTDEWTWTRKVISGGKEIEIKEVGDALSLIGKTTMAPHNWYQVKYNAEGEVISVEHVSTALKGYEYVTDIKNVEKAANEESTVLYVQSFTNDQPSMMGSTLFVNTKDKTGFHVAEDVNITLIQYVKNVQETTFETGVDELEKIIADLNKENGKFDYTVNAILEDGSATSVVIRDEANSYNDQPDNPDVKPGEFLPASWNSGDKKIELRYYKTPMSDSQIKDAIADLLGEPVDRLNKILDYVVLENGDIYPVDFDQIQQFALFVDGEIVDYADSGTTLDVPNAKDAKYILDGAVGSTLYKGTDISANADRYLYTAYQVTGLTGDITAKLDDGKTDVTSSDKYVAEGYNVVVTFSASASDGYNVFVGDELVAEVPAKAEKRTVKVEVSDNVTITKKVSDTDLATLLEGTNKVINLEPGETYTLSKGVKITSDKTINGNGATIKTKGGLYKGRALNIEKDGIDLVINDVNFVTTEDTLAIKEFNKSNYTVELDGCSFKGYKTSVQFFNLKSGEITNCMFDSELVDISITNAASKVLIEGNTYTAKPSLENIGLGGSNEAMNRVEIKDTGITVNRYPS